MFWGFVETEGAFSGAQVLTRQMFIRQLEKLDLRFCWIWAAKWWTLFVGSMSDENASTLSLPSVINVKFPLQPHQKYDITAERTWLFIAYADGNMRTTNSHYLTYTFLFRKVGRMYVLNLGVKGLKQSSACPNARKCSRSEENTKSRETSEKQRFCVCLGLLYMKYLL